MKKTVFSKIFLNNVICAFVAIVVLTSVEFALVTNIITESREEALKKNAMAIASLIEDGTSMDYLSTFLVGFSRSANRNVIIIDNEGQILMHSVVTEDFDSNIKTVPQQYCKKVLSNKESSVKGTMGIYHSNMFTLQIPIVNAADESNVMGAIMLSMPFPEMRDMESRILKISLASMLLVIIITFILSFGLSKRISTPVKQISKSAKSFAKRDFSQRIDLKQNAYNIQEMRELADTFNNMADELEKSEEIRNNFVSDVSHELRTPMTTIGGFVEGILDGAVPEDKQRDYLVIVKDEITRLTKLVNNFLDVTRLQNNNASLEYRDFDIAEMIRLSVISLGQKIEEKNIDVELNFENASMYVNADRDSIKRVVTNLLDNAVKFTEAEGKIVITAEKNRQETTVKIYNTGAGIAEDDKLYIFKRFYKADKSRSVNKEGTGIGLFIAKEILVKHGKNIRVESKEGEYAEFIFTLDNGKSLNKY